MTHEELLARIAKLSITPETNVVPSQLATALMAVVELHKPKPYLGDTACDNCTKSGFGYLYPCPTILAIEKELQ
jgi:hypothetical protein